MWRPSDLSVTLPLRSNVLEFQDNQGEWHDFTIQVTPTRIVFGGVCTTGFLESGYLVRDPDQSLDESLSDLLEDLQTYYNDGPAYVSLIVCNDRM